ncbi:uncharacterized protein G2W53_008725 [Senna tora]|uniref:Uncharacterized protein n=1 Tax=Senna tora TaxID=362788 RepID=A0A835C956_9FABA|nr:uncharacterized protein G2W53_008725 [Senna tora]
MAGETMVGGGMSMAVRMPVRLRWSFNGVWS